MPRLRHVHTRGHALLPHSRYFQHEFGIRPEDWLSRCTPRHLEGRNENATRSMPSSSPAPAPSASPAQKLLSSRHELSPNPDLRSSGPMSADEVELVRRALSAFKREQGITIDALVALIQLGPKDPLPFDERTQVRAFWAAVCDTLKLRKSRSVRDWVRKHYAASKNTGRWSAHEDQRLADACAAHPKKWVLIASVVGARSADDCFYRWRDYGQHSRLKNTALWSDEEVNRLRKAVDKVRDVSTGHIAWPQVSDELGQTRSRVQCLQKWQQLQDLQPRRRRSLKTSTAPKTSTTPPKQPAAAPLTPRHANDNSIASEATEAPPSDEDIALGLLSLLLWIAIVIFDNDFRVNFDTNEEDVHWAHIDWFIANDDDIVKAEITGDAHELWRSTVEDLGEQGCFADTVIYSFNYVASHKIPDLPLLPLPSDNPDMDWRGVHLVASYKERYNELLAGGQLPGDGDDT
ncbi:hypothetical protein CC80DRAFT_497583 [Byssothecium circinans]|uniref:Uncharacterized protein n=1 Tax=Byssothecium circinans TaxID=147558 RepID=A0A6A5TER5_9PLEO|nr:hypothetical protein CC80DRAFT_497583 [Byssothecium circinans]